MVFCVCLNPALQRSLFLEQLRPGHVNRVGELRLSAGGKGVNAARVVRQLGGDVALLGLFGGETGSRVRSLLDKDDIRVIPVSGSEETRCCHTLIDRNGRMQTELVEEAAPVSPDLVRKTVQLFRRHLARCSIVVLSGTVPPGFPESVYADFIEQAGRAGKPVVLDASGTPLRRALDQKVMLIKPNRTELESLSGVSLDTLEKIVAVMKDICSHGPEAVLMTDQEKEAWFFHEDALYRVHVPALAAVNPIGSGDAVTAGFVLARIRGLDFVESVRYAAACGCANVLTPIAGHVDKETVETLLPGIQIEMVIS